MKNIYLILFFIFGTYFGSFFTVVGLRLPLHQDIIKKRSHCDHCKHPLSLIDMIPILSFLFLRGRCHYCKEKINPLSTYMEFFTGILFSLSYFVFGWAPELFIALGIASLLVILSVSDITYYVIPDEVLIFFSGYFIILNTLIHGVIYAFLGIFYGIVLFLFMYLIMMLGNFVFRKDTLGGGDIKLMFVIGQVLNPFLGIVLVFIASFIALPVSLLMLWKNKQKLVPFGPFLLISFMFLYFTGINIHMILEWMKSL